MATTLPITSEAAARPASSHCHCAAAGPTPSCSRRNAMPNAASFGAALMNSVTGVGAPW